MPQPDRPSRAARPRCHEQGRWQDHGLTWLVSALLAALAGLQTGEASAQEASSSTVCLPPEEPYVPGGDEDFREYADVVSGEFERYFSELTAYFTCMDGTRQAVFNHAREVSKSHQAFWTRAEALGVVEKAATGREHSPGSEASE